MQETQCVCCTGMADVCVSYNWGGVRVGEMPKKINGTFCELLKGMLLDICMTEELR